MEEDLKNKSPLLLKHNPVHKKVPVLVHQGNPISESLIIIESMDETWNNNGPSLLPMDPYKRAQIRLWVTFLHQKAEGPFVNGQQMGVLDIVMCSFLGAYKLQQQVLGIVLIPSEKFPVMVRWLSAMAEHPVVKEAAPPPEKILGLLRFFRHNALQPPPA